MATKGLMFLSQRESASNFVGFDLNEDHLKMVHVKVTKLKREVVSLASFEVKDVSESDLVSFIKKTLNEFQVKNPRGLLLVPMHTVITRSIEIPSRDPAEIKEIVNLQAGRHTPYSRSEIIVDTLTLGLVRENYTKVLLIIVPREVVVKQMRILEQASVNVEKVLFSPEGICKASLGILHKESSDETIAIVHMDAAFTNFIVVQKNNVLFVRGISIGARQLTQELEAVRGRFVDELQNSLESYTSDEAGPTPGTVLLTGLAAESRQWDDLFTETLRIPIQHQTYLKYFSVSKSALETVEKSKHLSFFNLVASLLLFNQLQVDLSTEEHKLSFQMARRGQETVTAGIWVMVILGLLFALFASKVYFKQANLDKLIARYDPVIEDAKQLEEIFARTQVVKGYLEKRGNSIEALSALYSALPKDVRVSSVRYDDGVKFSVKGTSSTMASVFNFVTDLEKSKQFKNVKTKYITSRDENGINTADFEIVSELDVGETK